MSTTGAPAKARSYSAALTLGLAWIVLGCATANARVFPLPGDGSTVIGEDSSVTTVYEDSLPELAHRKSMCGFPGLTNISPSRAGASFRPGRARASW